MEDIEIEKLRQIVSRTDKTGNEKVNMLVEFAENYHNEQMQVKNINYDTVLATGRKCIHSICALDDCPYVYKEDIICPLPG